MSLLEQIMDTGYSSETTFGKALISAWRQRVIRALVSPPSRLPWPGHPGKLELDAATNRLNTLHDYLEGVDMILRQRYGVPHLHNVRDPLAELLLIVLSRKTPEDAYLRAFHRLLQSHDSWEDIHHMEEDELQDMVEDGGLASKKVAAIRGMLTTIHDTFGEYSLESLEQMSDQDVLKFLASLDEVGPKSALCVMMYALERPAFPVDAHVGRFLTRLGIFTVLGLDLGALDHKQKQRYLQDLVPPELRYSLHVNALMIGRELCPASSPSCEDCPLSDRCYTGLQRV